MWTEALIRPSGTFSPAIRAGEGILSAHGPFHARFPGSIRAANLPHAAIFALA